MKLYLSSYQLGSNPERLVELFGKNKKIGLISNSLDFSTDIERLKEGEEEQIERLKSIDLLPEIIDLKDYFGRKNVLRDLMNSFGGVWVRGGNTFVLAVAFRKSGFDEIINNDLVSRIDFVYAGFSAGCCVLQENLKGLEFVDDPAFVKDAYGIDASVIWEGVGLLDYVFVPHFESDHPESDDTNDEIEYYRKNNIKYRTLKDGEVIIDEIRVSKL